VPSKPCVISPTGSRRCTSETPGRSAGPGSRSVKRSTWAARPSTWNTPSAPAIRGL